MRQIFPEISISILLAVAFLIGFRRRVAVKAYSIEKKGCHRDPRDTRDAELKEGAQGKGDRGLGTWVAFESPHLRALFQEFCRVLTLLR